MAKKKNCYFVIISFYEGERVVELQEDFRSLRLERTPSSSIITVFWTDLFGTEQTCQIDLDCKEHIFIYGV